MQITLSDLNTALSNAQAAHQSRISHNDQLFLRRIYCEGLDKYTDRLRAIGFTGHQHVLDAGCGYGQWSLALAGLNRAVSACDISPLRMDFLDDLTRELAIPNLDLCVSGIDALPYADALFDAVFCYGVVFLTPWRQSLRQLARVLKPGGTLYVNANGIGWYIYLWQEEHNKADDYDPKAIAAGTFTDTLRYDREGYYEPGMNLIIEPKQMQHELQKIGFLDVQTAHEGGLHLDKASPPPKSFFKSAYRGQIGVYEITGIKK